MVRNLEQFTKEELEIAKQADLTAVAVRLGYSVKRIGNYYTLKEMDSIRIYNKTHWFRWSRQNEKGENGGSQIDFLKVFAGMEIKEAVFWLLDFMGNKRNSNLNHSSEIEYKASVITEEKKIFSLPPKADSNSYLYSYLTDVRAISAAVVDYFASQDLIYESSKYHNIIFKGNDKDGRTRFANMRGVFDKNGKGFKCDVAGNDKNYGFNIANKESGELIVFEAAIDLMSYVDIFSDYQSNKLALGMLSDAPLETFLKENEQITSIWFCPDNDEPGRKATEVLLEKYYGYGYEVEDHSPPVGFKDYNEWLQAVKQREKNPVLQNHCL